MKVFICLVVATFGVLVASEKAHISYSTLKGTVDDQFHTVNFTLGVDAGYGIGITFLDVMNLQSVFEPDHWEFTTIEDLEYGVIVTSIDGLANDPVERVAWQLFITPNYPSENNINVPDDKYRVTKAVDKIEIEDNQHFMFVFLEYKENSN